MRVAAPLAVDDEAVRLAVVNKLAWIKRQRVRFQAQPRQSVRRMVSGESHYFLGQRYRLRVVEEGGAARLTLRGKATMLLNVPADSTLEKRQEILQDFYRTELKKLVPELLDKWQPVLGVKVNDWGIRRMKTKWGSCNIEARRIWLNLELAKKPVQCLEYIIVHELTHLLERHHNERFVQLLDQHLPQWRMLREELNGSMLADFQSEPVSSGTVA